MFYHSRAARLEFVELRLISSSTQKESLIRIRAHRDELIAMDQELSKHLELSNDASLTSSPI